MLAERLQLETVRRCLVGRVNPHPTTRSRPALRRSRSRAGSNASFEPTRAADARLQVERLHDAPDRELHVVSAGPAGARHVPLSRHEESTERRDRGRPHALQPNGQRRFQRRAPFRGFAQGRAVLYEPA
jgi:hypothetical protein